MPGFSLKPDMSFLFKQMPAIGAWIESEYNKAQTYEDMVNLVYSWLHESDISTNTIREFWYQKAAEYLYTSLTNRYYQTKQFQSY